MTKKMTGLGRRFWAKVLIHNSTECWPWTGARQKFGHGVTYLSGRNLLAHRASWLLHNGPIPDGIHVLHRCDNPPCVNPAHLFLGTQADNMTDRAAKGRAPRGELHHASKLDNYQAATIRASNSSGRGLAKQYGVSEGVISLIRNGKAWRHLGN